MTTEQPTQLERQHDDQCEATADGELDPREVCQCQNRAEIAAAKAAGPVVFELDDDEFLDPVYPHADTDGLDRL